MTSRKHTLSITSDRILVTYATRAGSTAGVAEAIANTLAEQGLQVDMYPMDEVDDLTPYGAVVAGSAIRYDRWLPEAMAFVKRHQAELQQMPFAPFLVCMAMASNTDRARRTASSYLQPVRDMVAPVSEGLFAGVLNLSKLPKWYHRLPFRVVVALGLFREGDYRDWSAIRGWANELSVQFLDDQRFQNAV